MRITAAIREEAANMCSMRASEWANTDPQPVFFAYPGVVSPAAYRLAVAAYDHERVRETCWIFDWTHSWAEAEAMIREGWTP